MSVALLAALWAAAAVASPAPLPAPGPPPARAPVAGAASAPCGPEECAARQEIARRIGEARTASGLEVLTVDSRLCAVAERRAEEVAAAGNVHSDSRTISTLSQRLFAKGYQAHRWTERAILGYDRPEALFSTWARSGGDSYRDTVLGSFEDVGVGVAHGDEGTAVVILFAVPKISEERRLTAPLADLARVRKIALEQVERARRKAGRPPVSEDPALDSVAQRQAEDMLHRGYYAHESPEGTTPGDRVEHSAYGAYRFVAENIAKGIFEPDEVVDRWLASPHHRANILHPLARDTGLGVAFGDTPDGFVVVWVQLFARRGL